MQGWLRLFQITVKPKVSLVKPVKQLKASTFWSDSEPLGKRQYKTMEARSRTLRHSWAWQPDDVDGTETILTMHTFALSQTGIQSCCWASEALLQILHGNGMELSGNVATHRQKYFGTTHKTRYRTKLGYLFQFYMTHCENTAIKGKWQTLCYEPDNGSLGCWIDIISTLLHLEETYVETSLLGG